MGPLSEQRSRPGRVPRRARKFGNKLRIRGKITSNEPATLTFGVAAKWSGPPRLHRIAASQGDPTAKARCVPIHPDGRSGIMRRRELFRGCYFLDGGKGRPLLSGPAFVRLTTTPQPSHSLIGPTIGHAASKAPLTCCWMCQRTVVIGIASSVSSSAITAALKGPGGAVLA